MTVEPGGFEALALDIARFQYRNNTLYRQYCHLVGRLPDQAGDLAHLAFLPIQFFKQTLVSSNAQSPAIVFESSTTTGARPSRHGLWEPELYAKNARRGFEVATGQRVEDLTWLALLPSYLERPHASLVYMMRDFVARGQPGSGFFLDDFNALAGALRSCEERKQPAVLLGVSFALLDFAQAFPMSLQSTMIVETGGMKGRREEMTRATLHATLQRAFGVRRIGSEYGMTEMLSQAWSAGGGRFQCAPTLRVMTREIQDPLELCVGRRGALNCIDLANIDSCSFIATDDTGLVHEDGTFEMFGRLDGSEQRGCNLMVIAG
ncbi:MAG: acyl transferase [Saprospiraceae bacterium]|nr:acyl transferase [Saprospiraceae bacterium]